MIHREAKIHSCVWETCVFGIRDRSVPTVNWGISKGAFFHQVYQRLPSSSAYSVRYNFYGKMRPPEFTQNLFEGKTSLRRVFPRPHNLVGSTDPVENEDHPDSQKQGEKRDRSGHVGVSKDRPNYGLMDFCNVLWCCFCCVGNRESSDDVNADYRHSFPTCPMSIQGICHYRIEHADLLEDPHANLLEDLRHKEVSLPIPRDLPGPPNTVKDEDDPDRQNLGERGDRLGHVNPSENLRRKEESLTILHDLAGSTNSVDDEDRLERVKPSRDLRREEDRLATLATWPCKGYMDVQDAARCGLYYTGHEDILRCHFCRLELKEWQHGDNVEAAHNNFSPSCPLLEKKPVGNAPLDARKKYIALPMRVSSFEGWPDHKRQTPKALADAGFYYTGTKDLTICFSCGVLLHDWEDEDNPWEQHVFYSKHCSYLKEKKGEEFIAKFISEV